MNRPQPARQLHEKFCHAEKWTPVRDARGAYRHPPRHLRTRPAGPAVWRHILRDQLQVDDDAFWLCVQDRVLPNRGEPEMPTETLPAELVYLLRNRVGLDEATVAAMSRDEAVARLNRYWSEGP